MASIISLKKGVTFFKFAAVISMLTLISLYTISCTKSDKKTLSESNAANKQKMEITNSVIEVSNSDDEHFDMASESGEFADAALNAVASTLSGKVKVTYYPAKNVYPYTKTIDYGTGYTNSVGVTRSGKIIITYYNAAVDPEHRYSYTTYDNYYVNNIHVEGSVAMSKTNNRAGQVVYLDSIVKTISDTKGNVKSSNGYIERTLIDWQGGTANAYQIIQHVVGKQTYNGLEAHNFRSDVNRTNPVIRPIGCAWRAKGGLIANIIVANPAKGQPSKLDEYLDYGNGECDNVATLSINGSEPQVVTLPLQFWPLNL